MTGCGRTGLLALALPLLIAAGGAAAVEARGTLVVVAPDVEIVAERPGAEVRLPSAADSEIVAGQWLAAVGSTLVYPAPVPTWTAPPAPERRLAQVLALQEAIADTAESGALSIPRRAPTLGDGAHLIAAATGATHALFARIRRGAGNEAATALLYDLRDGSLVAHRAARDVRVGDTRDDLRLARAVLGRDASAWAMVAPPASAVTVPVAPTDDLDRATARHELALRRDPHRVAAPALEAYVVSVACRIDPDGCGALRPHVLREPGAQATAIHGGALVLRTGLLLRLRDEAELAFVLAHELAHVRRGDGRRRWADGAVADDAASRARESAADADAIARLAAAGYDADAPVRLWRRLLDEERVGGSPASRGSHPVPAERLAAAATAARSETVAAAGERGADRLRAHVEPYHEAWLADEVRRGKPLATAAMLQASLEDDDTPPSAAERARRLFALGELRRRHGARRDAASLYAAAVALPGAPPAAWRELGLARHAAADEAGAEKALRHYLDLASGADDAAFVRAHLADAPAVAVGGAPAGDTIRALGLRIPDRLPWSRRPGIGLELWTVDGFPLDRLLIVSRLAPDEPLWPDLAADVPRWRPGTRADETRDLVVAALDAEGWRDLRAPGLRPHDVGGVPGWRAELTLADARGLRYGGSMAFVERGGRLTLLLWFAPLEHYHARDAAAVAATLDGLRFAD